MDDLSRGIIETLAGVEGLITMLRPLAETGRHELSLHAAIELPRALNQDLPGAADVIQNVTSEASAGSLAGYPQELGIIVIYLQKISGGEPAQLPLASTSNFGDLRKAVCKLESCDPRSISLLTSGNLPLDFPDEELLSQHGFANGATLTLIRRMVPTVLTASDDCTALRG